ncbi:MAG: NAD(P)/FAD-dependent oxidoreductase [Dehalococcoidia bacterium]|nr:NAD(P)/FAD-dependent oxidoreductase [Dehalococcoidia bacterium]
MTGDIAIVGGGPAGAYLGYCLARNGVCATIFDDSHPREKPCGGGLTPFALEKFPLLKEVPGSYRYVDKVLFISPGGSEAMVSGQPIMNVSRESLDGYLLKKAVDNGAELIEERVTGVERGNDGWLVRTVSGEYRPQLLVGADGVNSVVRSRVIGRIPKDNMAACIGYYVKGVERDYSVLRFFKDFKGYAWIFPRESHSSIGIGLDIKRAKHLPDYLNKFIEDYCPDIEKISPFGALVPAARDPKFYKAPCSGEDWALIGDAAGHVDPVLGEGIRYALWDAELAAGAILSGRPETFDALWREAYYRDFVEACKLRDFIYDPGMLERGVNLISRSGTFAHIMMGVIAGTQSYRSLRKTVIASLPKILSEVK